MAGRSSFWSLKLVYHGSWPFRLDRCFVGEMSFSFYCSIDIDELLEKSEEETSVGFGNLNMTTLLSLIFGGGLSYFSSSIILSELKI